MSHLVELGNFVDKPGKVFKADLDIILRSNALVQANSGGGKSWLLRRMIEQSFRKVPQIVLDPEGEFSTLREKFDFVLVGKGGDTPADMRSAALLAHRLLELGASAVIDLFEMSKSLRPLWCATFIQALVDAPKKLWRELLLYVDEAHELAPEPGHGMTESRDEKLCRHALTDFAAKGRKRGYGVVAATQRLGKLSKDFAAELKNALVGQTWIDIDRERAAGTLGIAKATKQDFFQNVKNLEPGNFYALGRAFVLEPTLVRIGHVETEHPTPGRKQSAPPPPTAKIVHLLPQLADLPKEAEQKALTEKELRTRIRELEHEVAKKPLAAAPVIERPGKTKIVEVPMLSKRDRDRIQNLIGKIGELTTQLDRNQRVESGVRVDTKALTDAMTDVVRANTDARARTSWKDWKDRDVEQELRPIRGNTNGRRDADAIKIPPAVKLPRVEYKPDADTEHLPDKSQAMLGALMQGEAMGLKSMPFKNVALIAGVSPTSGTTSNRKRSIVQGGYAVAQGDHLALTDKGREYPLNIELPPTDRDGLLAYWKREIGTEKVVAMLEFVVMRGVATDEELREAAQMENSGTFSNYKRELTGRGLMVKSGNGYVPSEVFNR